MKYWVTVQWPHSEEESGEPHYGVYVPNGRQRAVESMQPGDIVFIFELKTGRTELRKLADGSVEYLHSLLGKEGIVDIVRVVSKVYEREGSKPSKYADGSSIWWRYTADTEPLTSSGLVTRRQLNKILGYGSNYKLRGFGSLHSGVMEVDHKEADVLLDTYRKSQARNVDVIDRMEASQAALSGFPGSGEGEVHLAIKRMVAANPEEVLGEEGLTLVKVEYSFLTGDRVDLVLRDRFGRYAVVEVEPECQQGNFIGLAQCVKYRALMGFQADRNISEIRSLLVSLSIDRTVVKRADQLGVETKVVVLG